MLIRWFKDSQWSHWFKISEFDYDPDKRELQFIEAEDKPLVIIDHVTAVRGRQEFILSDTVITRTCINTDCNKTFIVATKHSPRSYCDKCRDKIKRDNVLFGNKAILPPPVPVYMAEIVHPVATAASLIKKQLHYEEESIS